MEFDQEFERLIPVGQCIFICPEGQRTSDVESIAADNSIVCQHDLSQPLDMFLMSILESAGYQPHEAAFITGDSDEVYFGALIGLGTVLYRTGCSDYTHMPDHEAHDIQSLLDCLTGGRYGYFGELFAHGVSGTGFFKEFEMTHMLDPDVKATLFTGGRYFTSTDRRAYIHPLTHRILGLKNEWAEFTERMSGLLAKTVEVYLRREQYDAITVVPPRSGQNNRHIPVLQATATSASQIFPSSKVHTEMLRTVRDYQPQKFAGSHSNRFINVYNAFEVTQPVSGRHILIFDDIVTSGATVLECARKLYHAGAEKVSVVAFGVSQSSISSDRPHVQCSQPGCQSTYRLRFNHGNHSAFFGCENYRQCGSRGKTYDAVRRIYNLGNSINQEGGQSTEVDF